jgi:hypothetical protein
VPPGCLGVLPTEALIFYVIHPNAPLTPEGRRKLVELVIDDQCVQARVAERHQVSARRYRNGCLDTALIVQRDSLTGLCDRTPHPTCGIPDGGGWRSLGRAVIGRNFSTTRSARSRTNTRTRPAPKPTGKLNVSAALSRSNGRAPTITVQTRPGLPPTTRGSPATLTKDPLPASAANQPSTAYTTSVGRAASRVIHEVRPLPAIAALHRKAKPFLVRLFGGSLPNRF